MKKNDHKSKSSSSSSPSSLSSSVYSSASSSTSSSSTSSLTCALPHDNLPQTSVIQHQNEALTSTLNLFKPHHHHHHHSKELSVQTNANSPNSTYDNNKQRLHLENLHRSFLESQASVVSEHQHHSSGHLEKLGLSIPIPLSPSQRTASNTSTPFSSSSLSPNPSNLNSSL